MADRRIRRTKTNIFNALVHFLLEKDINSITVKELCERADVNKSTFYLHFMDIYDCKEKWKQEMFDELFTTVKQISFNTIIENPEICVKSFLDFFDSHKSFYQKLGKSPLAAEITHEFKNRLLDSILKDNSFNSKQNRKEMTFLAFAIGGIVDACYINIDHFDRDELFDILMTISMEFSRYVLSEEISANCLETILDKNN